MKVLLALIAALLAGCASGDYVQCVVPVTRDAGMGVVVPGCAAWQFSPSKGQTAAFERKGGKL